MRFVAVCVQFILGGEGRVNEGTGTVVELGRLLLRGGYLVRDGRNTNLRGYVVQNIAHGVRLHGPRLFGGVLLRQDAAQALVSNLIEGDQGKPALACDVTRCDRGDGLFRGAIPGVIRLSRLSLRLACMRRVPRSGSYLRRRGSIPRFCQCPLPFRQCPYSLTRERREGYTLVSRSRNQILHPSARPVFFGRSRSASPR